MTLTATILGCGSSGGVPRPALGWGRCDPRNPKNRRRRCSMLVERRANGGVTRALIDTSPDLREQLIDAEIDWLDGVLITHEHADHTHGIDDLRALVIHRHRRVDVYSDERTSAVLNARFGYCFVKPQGSEYPPILNDHRIAPGEPVAIDGAGGVITLTPFLQDHGDIHSLGFRVAGLAYSADLKNLPPASLPHVQDLDIWVVDALRFAPHPSHFSLDDALHWIERLKPRRAVLTNLHSDLDYDDLCKRLPAHIRPAYDGMRIEMAG